MSRVYTIEELNKRIDELIVGYESELNNPDVIFVTELKAKIESLQELKLELNSPEPIVNVSENVQQSLNAITAQNIINNDL